MKVGWVRDVEDLAYIASVKTNGHSLTRPLTDISRERGLQSGLPLLALQGLYERRLLSTDVRAGAAHHKHVKVVAGAARVPPDEARGVRLVNSHLRISGGGGEGR